MNYVLTPTAVRKLRRVLAPTPGNTGAGGAATPVSPDNFPPPFTVRWSQSQSSGEGAWVIWLPDTANLVMYETDYITPSGISPATALPSGWYKIIGMQSDAEEVWLVAHIPDPDETGSPSAELSDSEGQATTGESVINLLIAQMETDDETGAKRVKQFVDSAVVFGGGTGGESVVPDDVSTEFIPDPPAGQQPDGDEGKLQIFDFDSNESDSPEGLAERLHADTKTGDIKIQSGTNIMLLARRDGKMVYIPLTAGGTDPEDEKPYDPENPDPCAHPGDNAPGAETHSDGGGGGVVVGGGGVPAGGDIHTGDDDCNCERI